MDDDMEQDREKGLHQPRSLPLHNMNRDTPFTYSLRPSRMTTLLALVFLLLTGLVYLSSTADHGILDALTPRPLLNSLPDIVSAIHNGSSSAAKPRLAIRLHPEVYRLRSPTIIKLEWRISQGLRSPDGVEKRVYLINDDFPPTIEARTGDELVIKVFNDLENQETVAIHWHGLYMEDAIEMDGTVGITQCPISSGQSYEYRFRIPDQHGTFWYHAHDHEQRSDGLFGGLVIHEPVQSVLTLPEYDEDRLLLIGDWYNSRSGQELLEWYQSPVSFGMEPVPESLLVNYVGAYDCSLVVRMRPVNCTQSPEHLRPQFELEAGKKYRIRTVNTGTLAGITVSAPGLKLKAFEVDGGHGINSQAASSVGILYPGERVDYILEVIDPSTAIHFEISMDDTNFRWASPSLMKTHRFPITVIGTPQNDETLSPQYCQPYFDLSASNATIPKPTSLPRKADTTILVYVTNLMLAHLDNIPHGFLNHTFWSPQSDPALPLTTLPRSKWDAHQFVVPIQSSRQSPKWVDLVINNQDADSSHPFHLHGHSFFVLASCTDGPNMGVYNPFEDEEADPPCGPLNLLDPVERDTVLVPRSGYVVLRFLARNQGVFLLHCHVLMHQASGMAMGLEIGEGAGEMEGAVWDAWGEERRQKVKEVCGTDWEDAWG